MVVKHIICRETLNMSELAGVTEGIPNEIVMAGKRNLPGFCDWYLNQRQSDTALCHLWESCRRVIMNGQNKLATYPKIIKARPEENSNENYLHGCGKHGFCTQCDR